MDYQIGHVSDYLERINLDEGYNFCENSVSSKTMYRGQANIEWTLRPSLYRGELFSRERVLIKKLEHFCPNELENDRFSSLVKLQHYGMPTRLLDVSSNPLVALYFSCYGSDESKSDGVVHIFRNMPTFWSDDYFVKIVMDYIFEYAGSSVDLLNMHKMLKRKYYDGINIYVPSDMSELLKILEVQAIMVVPNLVNKRVSAQEGAFLLFGMKVESTKTIQTKVCYNFVPADAISEGKFGGGIVEKIVIPSESKKRIIYELDCMGINERTLFPELDHQIKYIVENHNKL